METGTGRINRHAPALLLIDGGVGRFPGERGHRRFFGRLGGKSAVPEPEFQKRLAALDPERAVRFVRERGLDGVGLVFKGDPLSRGFDEGGIDQGIASVAFRKLDG